MAQQEGEQLLAFAAEIVRCSLSRPNQINFVSSTAAEPPLGRDCETVLWEWLGEPL